jgi:hypothetical protein
MKLKSLCRLVRHGLLCLVFAEYYTGYIILWNPEETSRCQLHNDVARDNPCRPSLKRFSLDIVD